MLNPATVVSELETRDEVISSLREKISDLELTIETLKETLETTKKHSMFPHFKTFLTDLKELKVKMKFSSVIPGEICKRNVQLWDDEIAEFTRFVEEGATILKEAERV